MMSAVYVHFFCFFFFFLGMLCCLSEVFKYIFVLISVFILYLLKQHAGTFTLYWQLKDIYIVTSETNVPVYNYAFKSSGCLQLQYFKLKIPGLYV